LWKQLLPLGEGLSKCGRPFKPVDFYRGASIEKDDEPGRVDGEDGDARELKERIASIPVTGAFYPYHQL